MTYPPFKLNAFDTTGPWSSFLAQVPSMQQYFFREIKLFLSYQFECDILKGFDTLEKFFETKFLKQIVYLVEKLQKFISNKI